MSVNISDKDYIPALTGLRAVAAYMVFLHHFNPFAEGTTLYDFVNEFHVGVTLFFVLSGFLITHRYYHREKLDFKKYMLNRVARIYPLYFLLTSLTILVAAMHASPGSYIKLFKTFVYNITFIRGYVESMKFSGVAQGWSLTVEETFYFMAPLFFLLHKKRAWTFILMPLALLLIGWMLVTRCEGGCSSFMGSYDLMFNYTFFGRSFEFFAGMALSFFVHRYKDRFQSRYATYLGLLSSLLLIYLLGACRGTEDFGIRTSWGKLINNVLIPAAGLLPLYWGLITEKTFLSKALSSKIFILLGKSSYAFYLVHMGVIQLFLARYISQSWILFILLNLVSIGLYRWIEEPINLFIRRNVFVAKKPAQS